MQYAYFGIFSVLRFLIRLRRGLARVGTHLGLVRGRESVLGTFAAGKPGGTGRNQTIEQKVRTILIFMSILGVITRPPR